MELRVRSFGNNLTPTIAVRLRGIDDEQPAARRAFVCHHVEAIAVRQRGAHEQSANPYVTPSLSFKFHYFAIRKMHFMMRAKALVVFPGGFGTLDELFEVITLVQTRKSKQVPIILFGSDYWKRLLNTDMLVEEGVISPDDMKLLQYVDDPQIAWDLIKTFYEL